MCVDRTLSLCTNYSLMHRYLPFLWFPGRSDLYHSTMVHSVYCQWPVATVEISYDLDFTKSVDVQIYCDNMHVWTFIDSESKSRDTGSETNAKKS